MTIRIQCPQCQKMIKADEKFAGRLEKCPGCGGPVAIPAAASEPPDTSDVLARFTPAKSPVAEPPSFDSRGESSTIQRVVITEIRLTFDNMVRLILAFIFGTVAAGLLIGAFILVLSFVVRMLSSN